MNKYIEKIASFRRSDKKYKNPAIFRVDFIRENTFNRLWSIRLSRTRVIIISIASVAAMAALIWCFIVYTPIRTFIPGTLKGDLRAQYVETALRLDSLERAVMASEAYISNLTSIMKGETDSIVPLEAVAAPSPDSLAGPSEAEQVFVQRYEQEQRFNLSVLAPIAAEGMIFATPIHQTPTGEAVSSVYRGSVIAVNAEPDGTNTIIIQHPNDFVSVYSKLGDAFVRRGSTVLAGQRIGQSKKGTTPTVELWHKGTLLKPEEYLTL